MRFLPVVLVLSVWICSYPIKAEAQSTSGYCGTRKTAQLERDVRRLTTSCQRIQSRVDSARRRQQSALERTDRRRASAISRLSPSVQPCVQAFLGMPHWLPVCWGLTERELGHAEYWIKLELDRARSIAENEIRNEANQALVSSNCAQLGHMQTIISFRHQVCGQ